MTEFNKCVRNIAGYIADGIGVELGKRKWLSAYLDVRSEEEADSRLMKLRIVGGDGKIIKTVDPPPSVHSPLAQIWQEKDEIFPEKWFGLKITVFPDGNCETQINYDPDCVSDRSFFDIHD